MFRTRLIVGAALASFALATLFLDDLLAPWYPFLLLLNLSLGLLGAVELVGLLPTMRRPPLPLVLAGVVSIALANWARPVQPWLPPGVPTDPWHLILGVVVLITLLAFGWEMAQFSEPGEAVARCANITFVVFYLAVLASFLVQLRWLPETATDPRRARHALMLTIFVPKCCDIGAYCTGRLFGRHPMTPRLSPKKTWEGAVGGLALAIVTAIFGASLGGRPDHWIIKAAAFGLIVGAAGMIGDLAESLIKREGQKKDASAVVPGFGGVLDVIDSLLFAAPVAYVWLHLDLLTPL